ncbi:MAG: DUF6198 family protein [Clostridia bacterium]|nr:DUF6198 family protein [Clostridia bacterium]
MSKKELTKRYLLFIISLFFIGFGIGLTKHGGLGVSPISSVANIMSYQFTALSMGTWLTISNCAMILGQILLLRRNFQSIQLLQVPLSFLFGYFTDFGMWCISAIPNDIYIIQLTLVVVGVVVLGFGIALSVIADVILNSGEAFVKALADVLHKDFSNTKIVFDVSWVAFSIILSLIFFDGRLVGTREGTIISAICTGFVVKFFRPRLQPALTKLLKR